MDWQQEVKKAAGGAIKDLKNIPTRLSCMAARKPGARESIEAKLETKGDPTSDTAVLLAKSAPVKKAVVGGKSEGGHTFTFRIGTIRPNKSNRWSDVINTCLPGNVVNFRCSTKHESIYIDGERYGGRAGRLLESTAFGTDARIQNLTIGLSTSSLRNAWGGGMVANFNNFTVSTGGEKRDVAVDAELIAPNKLSWTYDRKKLGLELWLTGVSLAEVRGDDQRATAPKCQVPVAYTFTLAAPHKYTAKKEGLKFDETEFRAFWDWLTLIRQCEESNMLPVELLIDAAAEGASAGVGAVSSAGMNVAGSGLSAAGGLASAGASLGDKVSGGTFSAVGSAASNAASAGAKAAGSAAASAASAGSGAAGAGANLASGAGSAALSGAKGAAGGLVSGAKGAKALGEDLAQQAQKKAQTIFQGEKPDQEETGRAEHGQDVSIDDRDYHISKFGNGEQVGVLKMDPENPFTIATSGGYSAVIVRQGADVEPILFANGEQVNLRHVNFAELSFPHGRKVSEQISQLAIASALRDTEMLHEMGLVAQNGHFEEEESKTVIEFLKVSGARRVACEEVLRDDVDWDIYQIAAGLSSPPVLFAAAVCAAIQIGAPIAVFYVNLKEYKEEMRVITTDASQGLEPKDVVIVFFLRMVFVLYNLILELRELNGDDSKRLTLFLVALPQFSTCRLCLGAFCNFAARIMVSVSIVLVMLVTPNAVDIVLNSLALSFLVLVDNEAILPSWIEDLREEQISHRFQLKTKDVRLFQRLITHASTRPPVEIEDEEVKTLEPPPDFLASYPELLMGALRFLSWLVCRVNIIVLALGCALITYVSFLQLEGELDFSAGDLDFLDLELHAFMGEFTQTEGNGTVEWKDF